MPPRAAKLLPSREPRTAFVRPLGVLSPNERTARLEQSPPRPSLAAPVETAAEHIRNALAVLSLAVQLEELNTPQLVNVWARLELALEQLEGPGAAPVVPCARMGAALARGRK